MNKYFLIAYFKYEGSMMVEHDSGPYIFEYDNMKLLEDKIKELKFKDWIIKKIIKGKEITIS